MMMSPRGTLMTLRPHLALSFNGQCEAAFHTYAECLNGTIVFLQKWGDSSMAAEAPGWEAKVFHATLRIGEMSVAGGDVPPGRYQQPAGFEILLNLSDAAEAERIFRTLADGGTIKMPLQQTAWASRFGVFVDRFGIPWSINCE